MRLYLNIVLNYMHTYITHEYEREDWKSSEEEMRITMMMLIMISTQLPSHIINGPYSCYSTYTQILWWCNVGGGAGGGGGGVLLLYPPILIAPRLKKVDMTSAHFSIWTQRDKMEARPQGPQEVGGNWSFYYSPSYSVCSPFLFSLCCWRDR